MGLIISNKKEVIRRTYLRAGDGAGSRGAMAKLLAMDGTPLVAWEDSFECILQTWKRSEVMVLNVYKGMTSEARVFWPLASCHFRGSGILCQAPLGWSGGLWLGTLAV